LIDVFQKINTDPEVHVSFFSYNVLGQLVNKKLHYDWILGTDDWFQNIKYAYNSKGWLTKINSAYLDGEEASSMNNVYGEELLYTNQDIHSSGIITSQYSIQPQYNGNVAAFLWKTKAPKIDPSLEPTNMYLYRYDELNRMTAGYYLSSQPSNPTNFSTNVGYYDETVSYDIQGNIESLQRKSNGSLVDQLGYYYKNDNSNQLISVHDNAQSGPNDFIDGAQTAIEYEYNANGNVTTDYNKGTTFTYNDLDLPSNIIMNGNKYEVIYDASGRKLKATSPGDIRYYIDGIEYLNDVIQFIPTSEGRARLKDANATNPTAFVYDYYIKDHLNNVRAVITEEDVVGRYLATMEPECDNTESRYFYYIPETRANKPLTMPEDTTSHIYQKVSKLNSLIGETVGHAKVLSVKAGDEISFSTQYFYQDLLSNNQPASGLQDVMNNLGAVFYWNNATVNNGTTEQLAEQLNWANNTFTNNSTISNWVQNNLGSLAKSDSSSPYAFLTWMFFDRNFNFVPENSGMHRADRANELARLEAINQQVGSDGYLYIYVSNQSPTDVHFDNLNISHRGGQLLQTNSYYPYGLIIQNLSNTYTNGSNKYLFKSKELILNNDLKEYDYGARLYDPTLCRWKAQDPADQYFTPYAAFGNNPANLIDPDGRQTRHAQSSLKSAIVSVVNLATMPARYLSAATSQLEDKINGTKRQGSYYKSDYITKGASPYNRVHGVSYNSPSSFYDGDLFYVTDGLTRVANEVEEDRQDRLAYMREANYLNKVEENAKKAKPEEVNPKVNDGGPMFACADGDNSDFYSDEECSVEVKQDNATQNNKGVDFSLAVMYEHFQIGGGEPMIINASTIDFSGTTQGQLGLDKLEIGQTLDPVNLFDAGINSNSLAFGKLSMTRISDTQFSIAPNTFNFDYQSGASWQRNAGTILGGAINYNLMISPAAALIPVFLGGPYNVIFKGTVTIPK
jgi:RHS repeat-associated protein